MDLHTTPSPVIYLLHSGQLFGTERMAIATLAALPEARRVLLAPSGPALQRAEEAGITARAIDTTAQLFASLHAALSGAPHAAVLATGLRHSLAALAVAQLTGTRLSHLHVVHGGTDERESYGRKKWLRAFAVRFVAVSDFVATRLVAHGVPRQRIAVIENFLTDAPGVPRPPCTAPVQKAIAVSRLDRIKRVDVLLDALARHAALRALPVDVLGSGQAAAHLAATARQAALNVRFQGYRNDVVARLRQADLFIHTCPEEPFGLAVIEAMAAGVPVVVPDRGGPSDFVRDGVSGFVFRANDAAHLADRLLEIVSLPAARLNAITLAAREVADTRFCRGSRMADYRRLMALPT